MKITKAELFNVWGLSCLLGATFLTTLVLISIATQGYFFATERNPAILGIELFFLMPSAIVYFIYLCHEKLLGVNTK